METPLFKPIGTDVDLLDTPSLVVDVSILDQNIESMHSFFRGVKANLRPHVESHRCPSIARKQIADNDDSVEGIAVSSLSQAEVFSNAGFGDIFITNMIVTPQKISRLCALARKTKVTVCVDNKINVISLSQAAFINQVNLNVAIYINTGLIHYGVNPGRQAIELAEEILSTQGLEFVGLISHSPKDTDGGQQFDNESSRSHIQMVLDTRSDFEKQGIDVASVSVGGTYNYKIAGAMEGVTSVIAGSYALMDQQHVGCGLIFKPAAKIKSIVTSIPEVGTVITDAGQKSIGADTGMPVSEGISESKVVSLSAEHGRLETNAEDVSLGDTVWFVPWDIATCVNLHDYIFGVSDRTLISIWDVSARGCYV